MVAFGGIGGKMAVLIDVFNTVLCVILFMFLPFILSCFLLSHREGYSRTVAILSLSLPTVPSLYPPRCPISPLPHCPMSPPFPCPISLSIVLSPPPLHCPVSLPPTVLSLSLPLPYLSHFCKRSSSSYFLPLFLLFLSFLRLSFLPPPSFDFLPLLPPLSTVYPPHTHSLFHHRQLPYHRTLTTVPT